jgi:hypothetical protein
MSGLDETRPLTRDGTAQLARSLAVLPWRLGVQFESAGKTRPLKRTLRTLFAFSVLSVLSVASVLVLSQIGPSS